MAPAEVTRLLARWSTGDSSALDALMPVVFADLRQLASVHLRREGVGHTLQPTSLINEVYLRLAGCRKVQWSNRRAFFAFASDLMRRLLVDHARTRSRHKRGGGSLAVPLEQALTLPGEDPQSRLDLAALAEALDRLERCNRRAFKLVQLRFLLGFSIAETADALEVSPSTVKKDWNLAKRWLARELSYSPGT